MKFRWPFALRSTVDYLALQLTQATRHVANLQHTFDDRVADSVQDHTVKHQARIESLMRMLHTANRLIDTLNQEKASWAQLPVTVPDNSPLLPWPDTCTTQSTATAINDATPDGSSASTPSPSPTAAA